MNLLPLYRVIEWAKHFPKEDRGAILADHSFCRVPEHLKWLLGVAVDIRRKAPEA